MEIGSKLAIYKINKIDPPNGGTPFYKAIVFEKVYNSKSKLNKWETAFYDAYIFNNELELEPVDLSLGKNTKDKYSFDNIANADKSVIRVINFKYENHTKWYGNNQIKDDYGKPVIEHLFYLTEIEKNKSTWKSEERKSKDLEKKLEQEKEKTKIWKRKYLDLMAEINHLERKNKKSEEILKETKTSLKQANYANMVSNRNNKKINDKLEQTQQKLEETNKNLKQVKKMKKAEVIAKANEFIENEFDFGDL